MPVFIIACYAEGDLLHELVEGMETEFDACKAQPTFWSLVQELSQDAEEPEPTDLQQLKELLDDYSMHFSVLSFNYPLEYHHHV